MLITVFGASGGVGSQVASILARTEHRIRVVARSPERLPAPITSRAEVIRGSHLDPKLAAAAANGADAIFWMTPMAMGADVGAFNVAAAEAAHAAARPVARVVSLSGAYCDRPNFGLASHIRTIERGIEAANPNAVHLRAGLFMSNFALIADAIRAGIVTFPIAGEAAARFVAPADIAAAAVGFLLDTRESGHRPVQILGPDRLSFVQATQIIARAIGKPLQFIEQDDASLESLVTAGWPRAFVEQYSIMYRAFSRAFLDGDEPAGDRVIGITSLRTYATETLAPLLTRH